MIKKISTAFIVLAFGCELQAATVKKVIEDFDAIKVNLDKEEKSFFEKGDQVYVGDQNSRGVIKKIKGSQATITLQGDASEFRPNQRVALKESDEINSPSSRGSLININFINRSKLRKPLNIGARSAGGKAKIVVIDPFFGSTVGYAGFYEQALFSHFAAGGEVSYLSASARDTYLDYSASFSDLALSGYGKFYWGLSDEPKGAYAIAGLGFHTLSYTSGSDSGTKISLGTDWGIGSDVRLGNLDLNGEIRIVDFGEMDFFTLGVGLNYTLR